jgi:hypothetical protein
VELKLTSHLYLLTSGFVQQIRYTQPGAPLEEQAAVRLNNRTDAAVRGGFQYRFSDQWDVGAVLEGTQSDFQLVPESRNNRTTGYLLTLGYNQPRFYVNLTGGYREGRAYGGSTFPSFATPTGSFFVSFFPIRLLEIKAEGHRRIDYNVTSVSQPYYFENRFGGGVNVQVLPRVLLRGYALEGPNTYPLEAPGGGTLTRREDVLTYGGGVSIQVVGKLVLSGSFTRNVYTSNVVASNRSYNQFIANVSFSGEFQR